MNLTLTPTRFKERARRLFGNKVGIIDGDVRLTYRQYAERCDRLSNALADLGVPASTLKSRFALALARLRVRLRQRGWSPEETP